MKENGLVDKSTTAGFINNTDLNKKIAMLATKVELKSKQDKIKKKYKSLVRTIFSVRVILKMKTLKII